MKHFSVYSPRGKWFYFLLLLSVFIFAHAHADVVINEIMASTAIYVDGQSYDWVELHNNGSEAVSLAGWSVQYASAAGSSWQAIMKKLSSPLPRLSKSTPSGWTAILAWRTLTKPWATPKGLPG